MQSLVGREIVDRVAIAKAQPDANLIRKRGNAIIVPSIDADQLLTEHYIEDNVLDWVSQEINTATASRTLVLPALMYTKYMLSRQYGVVFGGHAARCHV